MFYKRLKKILNSNLFEICVLAVDGSVKLKQRGKDVMFEGEGKIVRLDIIRGCFGFIDSADVGSVFFNISAVRPSTTDVTKILKLGQKVKFRALPNLEQPNCKWRASIVCAVGKASEFLHARTTTSANNSSSTTATNTNTNNNSSTINNTTVTSSSMGISSSSASLNHHHQQQQHQSNVSLSSSMSLSSSANNCFGNGGGCGGIGSSSTVATTNHHNRVHRSGSADTRPKSPSFCSSSSASSENIAVAVSAPEFNSLFSSSCNNVDNSTTTNNTTNNVGLGMVGVELQHHRPPPQSPIVLSCWPINLTDFTINPAAMWEMYLEQQQKALSQSYNPFGDVLPNNNNSTTTASMAAAFSKK